MRSRRASFPRSRRFASTTSAPFVAAAAAGPLGREVLGAAGVALVAHRPPPSREDRELETRRVVREHAPLAVDDVAAQGAHGIPARAQLVGHLRPFAVVEHLQRREPADQQEEAAAAQDGEQPDALAVRDGLHAKS